MKGGGRTKAEGEKEDMEEEEQKGGMARRKRRKRRRGHPMECEREKGRLLGLVLWRNIHCVKLMNKKNNKFIRGFTFDASVCNNILRTMSE